MEQDKELAEITEAFVAMRLHQPRFNFSDEFSALLAKEYKNLRGQHIKMDRILRGITFKVHQLEDEQLKVKDEKPANAPISKEEFPKLDKIESKVNFAPLTDMVRELRAGPKR